VFVGVLLTVGGEERGPLRFKGGTAGCDSSIGVVGFLWDNEFFARLEAEFGLKSLDVVGLEGRTVDTMGTLLL